MTELYAVVGAGALALIFAFVRSRWIAKQDTGTDEMRVIAGHIQEGAMAFLAREYKVLAIFVAVVAVLLGVSNASMADSHALILNVLAGFSLGASSIALFARVGGGIYTKAADVGADLVGKVEAGIPEDDPRNPATIADNVGDNVGDVAGMGADLFESYVGAIIGSMISGLGLHTHSNIGDGGIPALIWLPLYIAAVGIGASIIGTFFVRTKEGGNPQHALDAAPSARARCSWPAPLHLGLVRIYFLARGRRAGRRDATLTLSPGQRTVEAGLGIFYATIFGLVAGALIGVVTEYYTSGTTAGQASPSSPRPAPPPTSSPASPSA
jgi:Na+/H+-translocating membrane pyrophosphatase